MMGGNSELSGPDLKAGIAASDLGDGAMLLGHAYGEAVLLARRGREIFAIGATCTHYSGPLAEGLMVGDTVRCPWHHACFSLRSGEALAAPAFNPVSCWRVEETGGRIFVRDKVAAARRRIPAKPRPTEGVPQSIVIIGGGAPGRSAAAQLRREGFAGAITMLSADDSPPFDRPNPSQDHPPRPAPPAWIPLPPP